jgi:hypothetical protein
MGNLIKPSEYAKKLGISRQAVYAKIKKGILESKNIEGKLYIVQTNSSKVSTRGSTSVNHTDKTTTSQPSKDFRELLEAKDETIGVLKETISDLKETNKMITTTLRSEVDLLKEAFSEMKMLYSSRIEHLQVEEAIHVDDDSEVDDDVEFFDRGNSASDELAWIELGDFFDELGVNKKSKRKKLAKKIKKLFKKGDSRVDSFNGEMIMLADADYGDILKKKKK